MKKAGIFILFFIGTLTVNSQIKISPNEKLVYTASYNMSGMLTNFAQIVLKTEKVSTSDKTYLNLNLRATTFSKWDTYFKIRDIYESYVNPTTLVPSLYKRDVFEGDYTKTEKYVFKPDRKTIASTSKRRSDPEKTTNVAVGTSTTDIVTALYKLRTFDYPNKKVGDIIPVTIIFDEKEIKTSVKYHGKEKIKAGPLGEVECYKISINSQTETMKGKTGNYIWITANSKRIPALFKFQIPVGTGQLTLTEVKEN